MSLYAVHAGPDRLFVRVHDAVTYCASSEDSGIHPAHQEAPGYIAVGGVDAPLLSSEV